MEILFGMGILILQYLLEADGFKYANGQLPRPTLTISNVTNVITAIIAKRKPSNTRK